MNYEGMFILDAEEAQDAAKKTIETLLGYIKKEGGSVEDVQEWGRRRLTHLAKKRHEGYYVVTNFSLEPQKVKPFQAQLRLNERVLKFILTQKKVYRPRKIRVRKPKKENAEATKG